MNDLIVVLPVLAPLTAAVLGILRWRSIAWQRAMALAGGGVLMVAAVVLLAKVSRQGILVMQGGNWPAPFGISFVADYMAAIMVVLAAMVGLAVVVYSWHTIDEGRQRFGYYPLVMVLLAGVCGAFLTGDLFNMYVWFEVMLISSFVLTALGGERQQLEGAIKYVTLNLISSAIFLAGVGVVYGMTGTLNMAHVAAVLEEGHRPELVPVVAMLFLVAFGIKAALFPLFFWLPAAYHTPPVVVSALFAGLLTKVGVYALIRVFTLIFVQDISFTHGIILVVAGFTMVSGVLGAASQSEFRRILSIHIISQIGYIIMGLALYVPLALAGAVFYLIHNIIVKTNLFLVAGIAHRLRGSYQLARLGGLWREHPWVGVLFLISAMSLAGIPPLSGFWAKFLLVRAGLELGSYVIVATALGVSLLTLFSMTKIWAEAFWKDAPTVDGSPVDGTAGKVPATMVAPVVVLAAVAVAVGLAGGPVFELSMRAAEQLMDRALYIHAVLGAQP